MNALFLNEIFLTLSCRAVDVVSCIGSTQCVQLGSPLSHLPFLIVKTFGIPDPKLIKSNILPKPRVICAQKLLIEDQLDFVDHIRQVFCAVLTFYNVLKDVKL